MGLADQHVHQRASRHHYELWVADLKEKLATVRGEILGTRLFAHRLEASR